MKYDGFIGGFATAQSPIFDTERTINWFVEKAESRGAKSEAALYPTPGVATFASLATTPVRGLFTQNSRCFAASGGGLYELDVNGAATTCGAISVGVGTEPVTICCNGDGGNELLVTSNGVAYIYTLAQNVYARPIAGGDQTHTETVAAGTLINLHSAYPALKYEPFSSWSPAFTATMGTMIDGYFILLDATTSTFVLSFPLDGLRWYPLDFQQRTAAGDRWISMTAVGRELWLFGMETTEVWYNAGTSPFPFALHPSGVIPFGCAAAYSVQSVGTRAFWLSSTAQGQGQVVMAQGFTPQVISTRAMEWALGQYSTLSDAVSCVHEFAGHVFYVLSFPTAKATWAYDLTTGLWCERGTWMTEDNEYVAWRPMHHAYVFGKHLMGDRASGTVFSLSDAYATDAGGRAIRRVRRAPVLNNEGKRLFFHKFTLDLEAGLGTVSGDGAVPDIVLNVSNNGGKTWFQAGLRSAGSGPLGEYSKRVFWSRLGSSRQRVFEVVCSDPVPYRLVAAYLDASPGTS